MTKQYLEFLSAEFSSKRKTLIFHIFNKVTGEFIGKIKWSCGWRQYVSAIETSVGEVMEFGAGCHREVADFIDKLMEERKNG
jgi:hypothetical protein